jgi:lipoprotein-releasing system permease protein
MLAIKRIPLNTEYFIARRFSFDREGKNLMSRSIVNLSVFAISLSITVMLITLAVVTGFKKEIRNKAIGFGSHIQLVNFDANYSFETYPVPINLSFLPALKDIPGIRHIQVFATKPGIIKAGKENQGVVAKGIGPDYDWSFFKANLVEGKIFVVNDSALTNDVLISRKLASMLELKVGDEFPMFFFTERPRPRRFRVSGIFETSLEEFDKQFILVDINHIRKLYDWQDNEVSGYEILIDDYRKLDEITEQVTEIAGFHFLEDGSRLKVVSIKEKYPQIFQWLNLLNMNVKVILFLMIVVAIVNMVSGLIIIILDRTFTIGLLKALGSSNERIKKIFLYQSLFLILKGLLIGNVLGLALCFLQIKFQILKLDQASYFIDYVPVNLTLLILVATNIGSLFMIFIAMYLPTRIILKIDPVKTLRYN